MRFCQRLGFKFNVESILTATLAITAISCAPVSINNEGNYSQVHGDSGISGRSYAQIVDELNNLEKSYPGMAKVITYGTSVGGEELTMIRIGKGDATNAKRPGIMIEGTIHGDEFLNIEDRLPRWFLENQNSAGVAAYLKNNGIIWIAPILNPDGYRVHRRENDNGKDLNRDFDMKMVNKKGFTQPETKSLIDTLRTETKTLNVELKLTMDYHCCVGALIYPWGHSATAQLPEPALSEHKRLAKMILGNFNGYRAGRAQDIVNYVAIGASDDFFYESMGASAFTFEGAYGVEHKNFDKHTRMWDQLLADKAGTTETIATPAALAISDEDQQGQISTWIGIGKNTASLSLCEGDAVSCLGSNPKIVTKYSDPKKMGDRYIFKSSTAMSVLGDKTYTILENDGAGNVAKSASIRFQSR
jgi:hypothetical protein